MSLNIGDLIPIGGSGNAVASNVLSGKTFSADSGTDLIGTMSNRGGAKTITPSTSNKYLYSGYYSGTQTIQGDSDLIASNIRSGKSIFGINGTLQEGAKIAHGRIVFDYDDEYRFHVRGLSFRPQFVLIRTSISYHPVFGISMYSEKYLGDDSVDGDVANVNNFVYRADDSEKREFNVPVSIFYDGFTCTTQAKGRFKGYGYWVAIG